MCGTHLDPQYLLRLFTMTVKGTWTDVPARPPFPYNNFSREGVHLLSPMV